MEIIGTIKQVFDPLKGTSKAGNAYTMQIVVITYGDGQYEKDLALTLMTKQVEKYGPHLKAGQRLKFHFDVSSREYNGRYYTECVAWKIESPQGQQPMAMQQPPQVPNYGPQYGGFQQPQQPVATDAEIPF